MPSDESRAFVGEINGFERSSWTCRGKERIELYYCLCVITIYQLEQFLSIKKSSTIVSHKWTVLSVVICIYFGLTTTSIANELAPPHAFKHVHWETIT